LSDENINLAQALVYVCLRHQSRLDFLIKSKLKKNRTDRLALTILRLGLAQILFFDRLKDYAIVSQTVELARLKIPGRHGLVNAILRKFLREKESVWGWPEEIDGRDTPAAQRLAVFYSHPRWLVDRLIAELGYREARALLAANNQPCPPTLRVNPKLIEREELAEKLPFPTKPTKFSPWGLIPLTWPGRPEAWPGFKEGHFAIQDEASQILGLLAGQSKKVLDACAGQGGKSLNLAAIDAEARIVAVDPNWNRLNNLLREAKRLNLGCRLKIWHGEIQSAELDETFDLVLVDAPCSGLGVIRRRPDLKWLKTADDIPRLAAIQLGLLTSAARFVAPGGNLIYSVCATTTEEGPEVLEKFLQENPAFRPWTSQEVDPALRELFVEPGYLKLWPHKQGTDGFFYGLLARKMD
jgi:16S rRNA (cytosine967-C5)-methyltransferase